MASIGGLSSSTANGIRGYGGLASGLDRDTLIEQLTAGTQAKIDAANQDKTKLQWIQEAIRSISDKMYNFTQNYTSYSSSTNLLGAALFNRTDITVNGENGKYVSVSGSTQTSELMTVLGVKQLAEKASLTTSASVSDRTLTLGSISSDLTQNTSVNVAGGEKIYLKYGNTNYTVTLGRGDGYSYANANDVAESINKSLKEVSLGNNKTLADVMEVTVSGGKLEITNKDTAGNSITLRSSSKNILDVLGFSNLSDDQMVIAQGSKLTASEENKAIQQKSILSQLEGKSVSFEYNGTVKWIKMPGDSDLTDKTLTGLKGYLQGQLDSAFGKGRIKVELTESNGTGSLSFSTTTPTTDLLGNVVPGAPDDTSTLSITASTGNLTGEDSLFGIADGESNRLNLSASLSEAGLSRNFTGNNAELVINGKTIAGITANSTIQEIIDAVNNDPDAGVTMSYQKNTDRFILTSTQNGASGQVTVSGNVADALFGDNVDGYTVTQGRDAVIAVQYAGSNEVTEITRDTNTVSMDGMNITVSGTFGYDANGDRIESTEAVSFTAKIDTDATVDAIKSMVEDFNEILALVNTEMSTKPDRDYQPLTSSQKADLSEEEIKLWETEAKKGLLFMDSDIRSLADSLRFVIPTGIRSALSEIGITTSTNYADNGKLTIDESKLKAALESDPESVKQLFTATAQTDASGNTTQGGLMTNIKTIMDKYASTTGATKGILIERAGSQYSVTSMLDNNLLDQMNEIDDKISRLTTRLSTEQDRYISQFTQLEMLVSQMNSQSSWLASMMGTGY